ncbi:hypothetical protein AB6A40_010286 [Gnathostoma spinigerum]|uniref:Rab proteins geranylgeranyltransferase component A n=1 Tax=Gnathostoma spinigerum TaxID=75299 RepID=A0ABD6EWS9_9BILA
MSDSESLPSDVDVIVYGTGLPESIIAGACARSGMTVLHLDRNSYYGGIWASFNLHTINEWTDFPFEGISCENGIGSSAVLIRDDEDYISLIHRNPFEHCSVKWHIEDSHEESPEGQVFTGRQSSESTVAQTTEEQGSSSSDASIESASEIAAQVDQRNNTHFANAQNASSSDRADDSGRYTRSNMEENWRRFNIDLLPKVLLSRGPLVQTLCDSEVAKYCEFKCVDRFLCIAEESEEDGSCFHYHVVPSSRAEIFQSETISMLEKRRVMKFLKLCIDWKTDREKAERELRGHDGQTFNQLLDSYEITGNVKNYIVETLAVLRNGVTVQEGIDAVSQFLESVGRFGNSPFLWTLYGSGELPQCFCRLCAVFGGVYCLNRSINGLIVHDNRVTAVVVDNQRINCKNIVLDSAFLPPYLIKSADAPYNSLNRAVLITDRSLLHDPAKEHVSFIVAFLLSLICIMYTYIRTYI